MLEQSRLYGGKCGIFWHRDDCMQEGSSENIPLMPPPHLCLPAVFFLRASAELINAGNNCTHTPTYLCKIFKRLTLHFLALLYLKGTYNAVYFYFLYGPLAEAK